MIVGTLLIPNLDYGKTVSAVDVQLNGSQVGVVYLDSTGNLKAGSLSCIYAWSDALSAHVPVPVMSGCSIVWFKRQRGIYERNQGIALWKDNFS